MNATPETPSAEAAETPYAPVAIPARVTAEQQAVLMRDLNRVRVKTRDGNSYLEAWDVKAHLLRIFGFGGYSFAADEAECIAHLTEQGSQKRNHVVVWKVRGTLVIPQLGASYSEYATGAGQMPDLAKAHDTAIKSAESDALKRCAIYLGTQFGLSLYNDGSLRNVVQTTLVSAAPKSTEDPTQTVSPLTDKGQAFLATITDWITEEDATARIAGIQAAKKKATGAVLNEALVVNGHLGTLARLADAIAQGTVTEVVLGGADE